MELSSLPYYYITCIWVLNVQKLINSFSILPGSVPVAFVQSTVNAQRQGDENPKSNVVAETLKFSANSSYGYQIMDRSRHTVTKVFER